MLSALGGRPGGPAVYSKGTATVADAMRQAGVGRFVGVTAAPLAPPGEKSALARIVVHPLLERMLGAVYDDMRRMELLLEASDLEWTVFRPPRLVHRPGTGRFRCAVGRPIPRGWSLPRADLAMAMLAAVGDHTLIRRAVTIAT
ncbi:MAG: NAD(P)-dependent oxidoreductase [Pseudonocardiaceae bacterium]